MVAVHRLALDLISLLFPELCNACGTNLFPGEREICIKCLYDLPYTDYHSYENNPVAKQLWARIPFHAASAMLYFKKGTKVQNLMHGLKYRGQKGVGVRLGQLLGEKLRQHTNYKDVDLIIPVPLHPKKERIRGYNQSEYIAKGVAETLGVEMSAKHLSRTTNTQSQTKKSRYIRFENMQGVFVVNTNKPVDGLHVLLIDDVITTGATLEACGNALLAGGVKKLSIAAAAFAE